jgi:hypothetical protein
LTCGAIHDQAGINIPILLLGIDQSHREAIVPEDHAERSGEERSVRLASREVRFHRVGLEQVPVSVNMPPSPPNRSSSEISVFVVINQRQSDWNHPWLVTHD